MFHDFPHDFFFTMFQDFPHDFGGGPRPPTTRRAPGQGPLCHSMTSFDPVCSFCGPGLVDLADLVHLAPPSCTSSQRLVGGTRHPGGGSAASEPRLAPWQDGQDTGRCQQEASGAGHYIRPEAEGQGGCVGGGDTEKPAHPFPSSWQERLCTKKMSCCT